MDVLSVGSAIEYVTEFGGSLRLEGGQVKLRLPANCPAESVIVETFRTHRDAVAALLADQESRPPSLEEVQRMLPTSIGVLRYEPKAVPFAVAPVSVITNAGKFFRAYLKDLAWRHTHPDSYAAPPLAEIYQQTGRCRTPPDDGPTGDRPMNAK
jgi:hypothetical protein